MEQTLLIVGLNHSSAPVEVREPLAFADEEVPDALGQLLRVAPAVSEAALLCTCNRVELVAAAPAPEPAFGELARFLSQARPVDSATVGRALYRLEGREAIRHLFLVSTSLDSMMVGEPQILGQVKAAYARAVAAGTVGLILHRAFHHAFAVAKRVRTATLIGHGPVSSATAAVSLAAQIFESLNDKTVLLIGAGQMGELTARQLARQGVQTLFVTSRTFDRALALARRLGGTAVPYENYKTYLKLADIVVGSAAARTFILGPREVAAAMQERSRRPMFFVDLGVPRNFAPELNALESVYLYDIDDLGNVVTRAVDEREREAEKARQMVELETEAFLEWMERLHLVPTIKQICSSLEEIRQAELGRSRGWLAAMPAPDRERVYALTQSLVNKLLHRVLAGLRDGGAAADKVYTDAIRRLFCEAPAPGSTGGARKDAEDDAADA